MKVKPVLGDWEIPRIESIRTLERRSFVELPVPGKVASLYQDLNTEPTRIALAGSLYGDEDRDAFLEEVRGKFRAGEPVTFVADIVTATEVQYVIVDALAFRESGRRPDEIEYSIVLRESSPPPPPADPLAGLDAGLLDDAAGFVDRAPWVLVPQAEQSHQHADAFDHLVVTGLRVIETEHHDVVAGFRRRRP